MLDGESSKGAVIDIDEVISSMNSQINCYWSQKQNNEKTTSECKIYRVQENQRAVDKSCYEPMILSIGPYYHNSPHYLAMEREKWDCLGYVLGLNQKRNLEDYLNLVKELEEQVRSCYADDLKMDNNRFLKMILLDGCFILVQLYGLQGVSLTMQNVQLDASSSGGVDRGSLTIDHHDRIDMHKNSGHGRLVTEHSKPTVESSQVKFCQQDSQTTKKEMNFCENLDRSDQVGRWYHSCVANDILLLENQIPFFVVQRIYKLVAGEKAKPYSPQNEIAGCVEGLLHYYPKALRKADRPSDFQHLLHLCHLYFQPSRKWQDSHPISDNPKGFIDFLHKGPAYLKLNHCHAERKLSSEQHSRTSPYGRWRRVMYYHGAGIEFKKKEFDENNPHSLLDITFIDGVMVVPCLRIDTKTSSLFRNLIGFEQTCPRFGNDFTAYIACLSQLMSKAEDVSVLAKRGIIVHYMRCDQEVSNLLSKLGKNVDFDMSRSFYLKNVFLAMEEHYQNRVNRWKAWLWQNHFSNPWLVLAVLAAAIVLLCTIMQTLVSFLAYLNQ